MQQRVYTSEQAFERLLKCVNRSHEKTLTRYDFQKAIATEVKGIELPEIDLAFDLLTDFVSIKKHVGLSDWTRIVPTQA